MGKFWGSIVIFFLLLTGSVRADQSVFELARDPAQRIAFRNSGGFAKGGVCWWHSRLQRAFFYLAKFDPAAPKPSEREAGKIIHALMWEKSYVLIPGFSDTFSFTKTFQKLIQRKLNKWQISDGVGNQGWILGLKGHSSLKPMLMKQRMDQVYAQYLTSRDQGEMLWLLLQIKGIASHSSLLESMIPNEFGGYDLEMIDSNRPNLMIPYIYKSGDQSLVPHGIEKYKPSWVPYVGYARDLKRIRKVIH